MKEFVKKQYVISSQRYDFPEMEETVLPYGFLYTHHELNTLTIRKDKESIYGLGNAFCMDCADKSIQTDISAWKSIDDVYSTRYWTGRWVCVIGNTIITDASGLMPAFYCTEGGNWIISSSLAILSQMSGRTIDTPVGESGINWSVLPGTSIEGINKLLPLQKIVLTDKGLVIRENNWIIDYSEQSTYTKCLRMAELLENGLKNISQFSGRKIYLALTGGKDSRLVFAALLKAGVEFNAYTAEHDKISHSDRTIPNMLASTFGKSYEYIKKKQLSVEKLKYYDAFTCKNSIGADRQFFAHSQFDQLPANAIVIRSGLFELGQTYGRSISNGDLTDFVVKYPKYYFELQTGRQKESFDQWISEVKTREGVTCDIRDQFYLEQRISGWASAIEQSLDLNEFISIQIANSAELLSILLSASETERKDLALIYKTIGILNASVMNYPVNKRYPDDRIRYLLTVSSHPLQKIRNYIHKKRDNS